MQYLGTTRLMLSTLSTSNHQHSKQYQVEELGVYIKNSSLNFVPIQIFHNLLLDRGPTKNIYVSPSS